MRASWLFALLGIAGALTSCASIDPASIGPSPDPISYRLAVRDYLRTSLIDPYSVRDAQISKPKPGQIPVIAALSVENGWAVCVRFNSKNRMGGYTGMSDTIVIMRDNRAIGSFSDPDRNHYTLRTTCGSETYEPFPELEASQQRPSVR